MSWDEKLLTMEERWKSPARHEAGKEQPIAWDAAKRERRKHTE
jgi:hypothetical protein